METIIVEMSIATKATNPVFNVIFAINIKSLYIASIEKITNDSSIFGIGSKHENVTK